MILLLHAHLPFVRHPEHERFLEEHWLFECLTESYLPLLDVFNRLADSGFHFRISMSISPTLQTMLSDELLMRRYAQYLDNLKRIMNKEILRTILEPHTNRLARLYKTRLKRTTRQFFEDYDQNILRGFIRLAHNGHLELITSSATHCFLPLLQRHPSSIHAQLKMACKTHERLLGMEPSGMWLPECGYFQGLEHQLSQLGINYFFTDTHGITLADPPPKYQVFAPIMTDTNTAVFGRDMEISKLVWSARQGYPGHPDYREFYRDMDKDVDKDILSDYLGDEPLGKTSTGIKYHRVTGKTENKGPYIPEEAYSTALMHARDLHARIIRRLSLAKNNMPDSEPVLVAPFDAELFGHWWFEGPYFLEELIKLLSRGQGGIGTDTPSLYLLRQKNVQHSRPASSSWGHGGYNSMWLNSKTDWLYNHLDRASSRMEKLSLDNQSASGLKERALNQAGRELMLAQSSDWPFILKTQTSVGYAEKAIRDHLLAFTALADEIERDKINPHRLEVLEQSHNIFPDMDFRLFNTIP